MYTDPSGHIPILPLIIKAGVNGAVDLLAQAAINYFFNPETKNNVSASFAKVNWWQVGRSTLEGAVPWKVPGGKYGKAAITAAGDVATNLLHQGNKYSSKQALTDFMVGFLSDLGGSALNDLIQKYGKTSVNKVINALGKGGTDALQTLSRQSVDDKLARYLLNMDHPVGGSKAKWFRDALGFTQKNADNLARQIVFDPSKAVQTAVTEHGIKYDQIISIKGANGKVIDVIFGWIKNNDGVVRLVTGIPTKK